MNKKTLLSAFLIFTVQLFLISCNTREENKEMAEDQNPGQEQNEKAFIEVMQKHLNAVSNRDLETLESTLAPTGEMQLILPETEIISTVDGFMDYHRQWFNDTTAWKFETQVLNYKTGDKLGMAVTEVVYSEPERDGKPYFNRMIVTYALEKIEGEWYVIKDHASSVEKSTDLKME